MQPMPIAAIPPPQFHDSEDVTWALSTAASLWSTGACDDALRWLRRAASAANDIDDERALELFKAAATLASSLPPPPKGRATSSAPPPSALRRPPPLPRRAALPSSMPPPSKSRAPVVQPAGPTSVRDAEVAVARVAVISSGQRGRASVVALPLGMDPPPGAVVAILVPTDPRSAAVVATLTGASPKEEVSSRRPGETLRP